MAIARPVVFPLFSINPDGSCACGKVDCSRVGKHPAVLWGEVEYGSAVPRPEDGAGVGLKTGAAPRGSNIIVVDVDSIDALEALVGTYDVPTTYEVETGRGVQLYFEHPGFPVSNSAGELLPGVDIRGDGGFVVAAGSPHKSGKTYNVVNDVAPAPCPAWLVEWLQARTRPAADVQDYPGDVTGGAEREYRRDLYKAYLQTAPPCVEGAGGDGRLFSVVQYGAYDLALPTDDVLQLVAEYFDPRCVPPWGDELEERVLHKAHCAKTQSLRPRAEPPPRDYWGDAPTPAAAGPQVPAPPLALDIKWGDWNKPFEPPKYLVEGLIPEGKVVTFYAEGGSVKTWSAFALAIAVAKGAPWLDHYVQQGRALVLDFEDGEHEYKRRRNLLCQRDLSDIPELGYLYGGPSLSKPELWLSLVSLDLKLVVVDALSSGIDGAVDENSSAFADAVKLAGKFTEACDRLGRPCTVVVVHHANKQGTMRGFSGARDQSDCVFKFEPVSETDSTKRMRMVCEKPGPQKKPLPVNIELTDEGLHTFADEAADVSRNAVSPDSIEEVVLLFLGTNGPQLSQTKIATKLGKATKSVQRALAVLLEERKVVHLVDGYRVDGPAQRRERILDAVRRYPSLPTVAKVADAASVLPSDVQALIDDGNICPRARGGGALGFMVLEKE